MTTPLPTPKAIGQGQRSPLARKVDGLDGYSNIMQRDKIQSLRLHEPTRRVNTTDPMTGEDIGDTSNLPSLVSGDLTLYFVNEGTRLDYIKLPIDHPNLRLPYPAAESDDRGG